MKKGSFIVLLILLSYAIVAHTTIVTFYIEEEVQQPEDYVQISAILKVDGVSLEQAIQEAAGLIKNVQQKVTAYCSSYTKAKGQCQNLVQASPYNINPVYEIYKKRTIFGGFVVAHELLIKVKDSQSFGRLVDDLLKIGVSKINSLIWKPQVEIDVQEIAVKNGIEQANKICAKIGMKLLKVINVMEVSDFDIEYEDQQEQQGEKGQDQQQEQEQEEQQDKQVDIKDGLVYYKFVVQCTGDKKLKKETK